MKQTLKEKLLAALQIEEAREAGKEIEWELVGVNGASRNPTNPVEYYLQFPLGEAIRIKPSPPWTLPPPPEGMKWHREGWTKKMLPEGWRPCLADEYAMGFVDEYSSNGIDWEPVKGVSGVVASDVRGYVRTERPLPEKWEKEKKAFAEGKRVEFRYANNPKDVWLKLVDKSKGCVPSWSGSFEYRIAPEPELIPLGPDDIDATCEFNDGMSQHQWIYKNKEGIRILASFTTGWSELFTQGWKYRRPGEEWKPCSKVKGGTV